MDVDQFYGIEIEEWPARIAEVALWLMDHQMNQKISAAFGQLYQRLPLKKSPHIHCANALRLDWKKVLPPEQCNYVLGNPPFVGAKFQTDAQRADMDAIAGDVEKSRPARFCDRLVFQSRRLHSWHAHRRRICLDQFHFSKANKSAHFGIISFSISG